LLTKIERREIAPMLTTTQAIWMPKFMPTEKEREKILSIAEPFEKGTKLEGLTIVFGAKANRKHRPRDIVERHRVAVSEDPREQLERIGRDRDVDCRVGQVRQLGIPWLTGIFHEYSLTIHKIRKNGINLAVSRMTMASSVRPLYGSECQWLALGAINGGELTEQAWRPKPSSNR
jgi:hypothetical protein